MNDSASAMRAAAEAHLRALAGEHARLRDDQWTAIRALVAERRRALVVQRTGWGKSAVYFVATALRRARASTPERSTRPTSTIGSRSTPRSATARSTYCSSAPSG